MWEGGDYHYKYSTGKLKLEIFRHGVVFWYVCLQEKCFGNKTEILISLIFNPPPHFFTSTSSGPTLPLLPSCGHHVQILLCDLGEKKENSGCAGLVDPDRDLHKAVIYIYQDRVHTNKGLCFHTKFFLLFSNRVRRGGVGRGSEVALGRQTEQSCESCLGHVDQNHS